MPAERFCHQCGLPRDPGDAYKPTLIDSDDDWDQVVLQLRKATVGEFVIVRELGRGGMATVFLAHDIALNKKVAIKVMAPRLLMGKGMVERFRQEAETLANLKHPHIVTVHSLRQAEGLHFFIMNLIRGRSLDRIIHDVKQMPLPVARAILFQAGSALSHAHRRGVIHRDVKPANILMDEDGDAVVTDFGIAKVKEKKGHTGTGATVGTPAYMSPEQCSAQGSDPRVGPVLAGHLRLRAAHGTHALPRTDRKRDGGAHRDPASTAPAVSSGLSPGLRSGGDANARQGAGRTLAQRDPCGRGAWRAPPLGDRPSSRATRRAGAPGTRRGAARR